MYTGRKLRNAARTRLIVTLIALAALLRVAVGSPCVHVHISPQLCAALHT